MDTKKVLIIANHRPGRSPSQRFRFEQYLTYLESNGFEFTFSYLLSKEDDQILYSEGKVLAKAKLAHKAFQKRRSDLKEADRYDIIFIHREAFLTAGTFFERKLKKSGAKMIFDFDDAIWLPNVSYRNKKLQGLKGYAKTAKIIEQADLVFAGNQYLANYAQQFNAAVKVVPTTIDTSYHRPLPKNENGKITIGWTGSHTTLKYLTRLEAVFQKLLIDHPDQIELLVICDHEWPTELPYTFVKWKKEDEIDQLNRIDIGVMPLEDTEWAKGKCGFKALQYMAIGIPAVISPVGVNQEIIAHEENGFLAKEDDEWVEILSRLIKDKELREQIGKKARTYIQDHYSVDAYRERYLQYFNELLAE